MSFNGQKLIPSITGKKPNNTAPPRHCLAAPLYIVDAFASGPFTGNPAAVCLLESSADAGWMQSVAAEMNLSETAFLVPREDGFDLRWFTPHRSGFMRPCHARQRPYTVGNGAVAHE